MQSLPSSISEWSVSFLSSSSASPELRSGRKRALVILNQSFSPGLFKRLWKASEWRCCADGGANHLYDLLFASGGQEEVNRYLPDLVKGDLDSIRPDVKAYYESKDVPVIHDTDQNSTDLMKCIHHLEEREHAEAVSEQYDIIILGGLSGRLDQTIHTLSYLHKLRKSRKSVMAVTDDNIGWVIDVGKHDINIDHSILGPTCGLLPVGIDETILTTTGLRWNMENAPSSFSGLMSTSNHLVKEQDVVHIETTRPIWWTMELRKEAFGDQIRC